MTTEWKISHNARGRIVPYCTWNTNEVMDGFEIMKRTAVTVKVYCVLVILTQAYPVCQLTYDCPKVPEGTFWVNSGLTLIYNLGNSNFNKE